MFCSVTSRYLTLPHLTSPYLTSPYILLLYYRGGMVVKWLAHWTLHQAVQVQVLAGFTALCYWASCFTLSVPLSTSPSCING